MDTIFVLGQDSRLRILQRAAARLPGCAYLCTWAPVLPAPAVAGVHQAPPPIASSSSSAGAAHLLCCLDGWLSGDGDDGGVRALFDAYRGSVCAAVTGCVPGWAYVDGGGAYMELPELDLAASASLPVQQRFYQEAGIKMAAFMGCESGEIEVGLSTSAAYDGSNSLQESVEQVFSEDFFQQSLLEELLQLPPTRPSSSSSSPLPSVSVGSPADGSSTSLLRTMTPMVASSSAAPSPRELAVQAATTPSSSSSSRLHPRPPPHHVSPFGRHGCGSGFLHFPSAEADDAAMAQAMFDVISSPSTSSVWSSPALPTTTKHRPWIRSPRRGTTTTAFRAYNAALAPRAALRRPPGAPGQRMIKMSISILRRTHMKDKATVLAKTLEYMNLLITQISELEGKNRALQTQIHQRANGSSSMIRTVNEVHHHHQWLGGGGGSPQRVQVHVIVGGGDGTSTSPEVTVRVAVRAEGVADLSELVLRVLALLKEMGGFTVVSVDGRQPSGGSNGVAQASLTLRATAGGFDEASLKEAVAKAVESLPTTTTMPPPPPPPP
ncbi:hypothetical protein E2562_023425 [Oryza meyeriana var. granulata]|uniref:BHLH domain-containing protein n=1 Tax=Oryza meyeriana var. granulata TaxID=110450 RepID=A0A6G1FBK5_9ORYZ|nr:hypothetical protein E2562_023425 [Oryza meyeriana var. granulata]